MGTEDQIRLYQGDCLEVMQDLEDGSIDMVMCDLPYGTTSNAWDSIISFSGLWEQWGRLNVGRVVLFAAQPFTSALVMSNPKNYRHGWTWLKPRATGFQNAKKMPMRATEDVLVFGAGIYNPQGLVRCDKVCKNSKSAGGGNIRDDIEASTGKGGLRTPGKEYVQEFTNYPRNVLEFGLDEGQKVHPTQKPVALMEYLIKTYTDRDMTVLDNCMGSGTTGVACMNTNRNFIGIEKDETYFQMAKKRIEEAQSKQHTSDDWLTELEEAL